MSNNCVLTFNADRSKSNVGQLNYSPIGGQAIQHVAEIVFSSISDRFNTRLPPLLVHSAINVTSLIFLIVRPQNRHAYFAGWYMNYIGG